ncbi:MAG: nucleoside 2-deoxyribosyltransferase [Anaerolineales bacterium]|nr:nucleoside 2-deoxyribosyltransferase [Anaerolineales bacterium]
MNIYFACSITGGRELEAVYQQIVAALTADGHEIPTSHLAETEVVENERMLPPQYVYERDVDWIKNCDILVAEVSVPSHGVGYEIGLALIIGKPVLCIFQEERKVSKMISGNPNPMLVLKSYSTLEEALSIARNFLKKI